MNLEQTAAITEIMQIETVLSIRDSDDPDHVILDLGENREIQIYDDGTRRWCRHGLRHREDGPAVVRPDGSLYWYQNGTLHRTDGPAVIWYDGNLRWFLNGKKLSEEEWKKQTGRN